VSQPSLPPLPARVAEGATLLDQREPGWHQAIDPDALGRYVPGRVLLDHLAARFYGDDLGAALATLSDAFTSLHDPGAQAWLVAHGFASAPGEAAKQLAGCWASEIQRRRAAAGPLDAPPGGPFVPEAEGRELLARPLAGVALGAYDRRILAWLAGWDTPTVLTVASLLARARAAGRGERQ
jgi:hypothetical protein